MCQTIALPPIHALAIEATTQPASSQWKTRVGRSQTRTAAGVGFGNGSVADMPSARSVVTGLSTARPARNDSR